MFDDRIKRRNSCDCRNLGKQYNSLHCEDRSVCQMCVDLMTEDRINFKKKKTLTIAVTRIIRNIYNADFNKKFCLSQQS